MATRVIRIKIDGKTDRDNVVIALANNGYKAVVEKEENGRSQTTDYYIRFEKEEPLP